MTCWKADPLAVRIMMIKNTRSLQQFFISNSLLPEAQKINGLQCSQFFSSFLLNSDGDLEKHF